MRIYFDNDAPGGSYGYIRQLTGNKSILIQTDRDLPSVARAFGWDMQCVQLRGSVTCEHRGTDGTIRCPDCGAEPAAFIAAASNYLYDHDGAEADDPGYFD